LSEECAVFLLLNHPILTSVVFLTRIALPEKNIYYLFYFFVLLLLICLLLTVFSSCV